VLRYSVTSGTGARWVGVVGALICILAIAYGVMMSKKESDMAGVPGAESSTEKAA